MAASSLLFSLCIGLQIFSGFADKLFLNIDCGTMGTRTDSRGMEWVGDDSYINAGSALPAVVQNNSDLYGQEINSLRYFPSQKKSCYVIPGVNRGRKHMVRASFFYGNYDGKSSPPSFHLQFDGNHWDSVTTSSNKSYYWEVIYAPKRENISVCVARKSPDQIPFISALEIREFEPGMYETDGEEDFLLWGQRKAFGSKVFVRYPDDSYDRYWHPSGEIDGTVTVARDNMSFIKNFTDIPGLALAHAITPASSNATTLTVPLYLEDDTYYYSFYFSEVLEAAYQNKSRSFDFLVDDEKLNDYGSIIPPYQSDEWMHYNHGGRRLTAGSNISLVNTPDASLPPILNAMELFKLKTGLADGTSRNDVNALKVLQGQYQQLQSWAGDPCLPAGSTWDWLNCNANDSPSVTELHLSGLSLIGTLPDFSGLTALEIIDLSNNSLNGQIPEFLGRFPFLKELNLADNKFTGSLPASLAGRKIKLNTGGNNLNESKPSPNKPSPPTREGRRSVKPIIIGVSVGSAVLLLLLVGYIVYACLRGQRPEQSPTNVVVVNNIENQTKQQTGWMQLVPNHGFTHEEIVKITCNFETIIAEGGSASVYYGCLNSGKKVAVKVLKDLHQRGPKEFVAEVKLLATVHHKNLVPFVGYCDEGMNMIVLYEYMQNGSLRGLLSGRKTTTTPLTWKKRLQIALDVAIGLEYLHSGCQPAIIHRDVKTTNILLNERLEAKLADFGISRADEKTQTSTGIAGTPGYIDPEYSETSILTKKSDVYSFGIVLFELICGHPAKFGTPEQYFHIVQWATSNIVSGEIDSIVDPRIKGQHKMNSMQKVVEVAIACTARSSAKRPHMCKILNDLNQAMEMEMEAGSEELEVSAIEVVITSESSTETSHPVPKSPRTSIRKSEA
ncbi:probable LRR receptor-like serine/threonine-protein kinase At1g05700 [Nymphaea colorata]|nr:probable LRR receptor-like serine/threonine-protein kinase At1g05700 [Nymphaea colorata]